MTDAAKTHDAAYAMFAARMLAALSDAESSCRAQERALATRAACPAVASDSATVRPAKG